MVILVKKNIVNVLTTVEFPLAVQAILSVLH